MFAFSLCVSLLAAAPAPVALVHANVVPMDVERVLKDQTLVVRDGKVSALGPGAKVDVPADATVVDATGKYLLPGFVAVQAAAEASDAAALAREGALTEVKLVEAQGFRPLRGPDEYEKAAYRSLAADSARRGLSLVGWGPVKLGFAEAVKAHQSLVSVDALEELALFPREPMLPWYAMALGSVALFALVSLTEVILALARRGNARVLPSLLLGLAVSVTMCALYVRTYLSGAGWIPTCLVGLGTLVMLCGGWTLVAAVGGRWQSSVRRALVGLAGVAGFVFPTALIRFLPPVERATPFGMDEVIQRCVEAPLYVLSGLPDPRLDMRNATDVHLRHGVEWGRYLKMQQQLLQKLGAAGLLVATPTHPNDSRVDSLSSQLGMLQQHGLSPFDTLRAATSTPAAFARRSAELGLLEVGRSANLVMTAENPLADVANCAHPLGVMKEGRWLTYPASTK